MLRAGLDTGSGDALSRQGTGWVHVAACLIHAAAALRFYPTAIPTPSPNHGHPTDGVRLATYAGGCAMHVAGSKGVHTT